MRTAKDLTHQKFDKLLVLHKEEPHQTPNGQWVIRWLCLCDCGKTTIVRGASLRSKHTKSCGCYAVECSKNKATHGKSRTSEYKSWKDAKARCYNKNNKYYYSYGSRGIGVCSFWRNSFENFIQDLGPKPKGWTLERKDVNKNYEPNNCIWASKDCQSRNRRTTVRLNLNGVDMCLSEACRLFDVPYCAVIKHMKRKKISPYETIIFYLENHQAENIPVLKQDWV